MSAAVVVMLAVMGVMYKGRDYATSERDKEQNADESDGSHHLPSPGSAADTHDRWWWFYMLFYPTLYGE